MVKDPFPFPIADRLIPVASLVTIMVACCTEPDASDTLPFRVDSVSCEFADSVAKMNSRLRTAIENEIRNFMRPPNCRTALFRALCAGTADSHEHGSTDGSDFAQPEATVSKYLQKDYE